MNISISVSHIDSISYHWNVEFTRWQMSIQELIFHMWECETIFPQNMIHKWIVNTIIWLVLADLCPCAPSHFSSLAKNCYLSIVLFSIGFYLFLLAAIRNKSCDLSAMHIIHPSLIGNSICVRSHGIVANTCDIVAGCFRAFCDSQFVVVVCFFH